MEILQWINRILGVLFFLCYAYQFFYLPITHSVRSDALPAELLKP